MSASLLKGGTAVITGAGSGFGLELARLAAASGMRLVLVDIQQDALGRAEAELRSAGAEVWAQAVNVAHAQEMERLGEGTLSRFGAPTLVFNNAGVATGGLLWEASSSDWSWVLGVNLMGVVHGVRVFTPMMLEAARADPGFRAHIVNTASMAGLVNAPNMGVYNVSKHAVVSLSETLYQDLRLITDQVHAHVLCPFFVPTGISQSHRNRPADLSEPHRKPTASQLIGQAMSDKAVLSGKVSAAEVAQRVMAAVVAKDFYIYSHPKALRSVQTRMEDVMTGRNPTDPFEDRPELGQKLRDALKSGTA
jgi:NAD(P)-dependent dehydrogenase (short-subunit alcohol dehydrogenase family)